MVINQWVGIVAPKNLAPVEIGQKKAPSALRVYNKVEIGKINQILNY
jgi:hypothetical protein